MLIANKEMMTLPRAPKWSWWGFFLENVGTTSGYVGFEAVGSPPAVTLEYSFDGRNWNDWGDFVATPVEPGERLAIRARPDGNVRFASSPSAYRRISISFDARAGGNILSLLSQTEVTELPVRTSVANYLFNGLFRGCSTLVDCSELLMPATTIVSYAYYQMFYNCTRMASAPALPATTLGGNCYESMFYNCRAMTEAPALPATVLASACYARMFYGCSGLTTAPALPPANIQYCFYYMFTGCTGLTAAPNLTATTVPLHGYDYLFNGCSSLRAISTAQTAFNDCPGWVSGVAASGTFTCPTALGTNSTIARGSSACPNGWTVVNT